MRAVVVALSTLCAAPAWAQSSAPAPDVLHNRAVGEAVFLYGRAHYFHDRVAGCGAPVARAADTRFDAARVRLAANVRDGLVSSDHYFEQHPVSGGACDMASLNAYAMHVGEFERAVAAIPDPSQGR